MYALMSGRRKISAHMSQAGQVFNYMFYIQESFWKSWAKLCLTGLQRYSTRDVAEVLLISVN